MGMLWSLLCDVRSLLWRWKTSSSSCIFTAWWGLTSMAFLISISKIVELVSTVHPTCLIIAAIRIALLYTEVGPNLLWHWETSNQAKKSWQATLTLVFRLRQNVAQSFRKTSVFTVNANAVKLTHQVQSKSKMTLIKTTKRGTLEHALPCFKNKANSKKA